MTRRLFRLVNVAAVLILASFSILIRNPATAETPPPFIKLIPSDGAAGDRFGYSCAVDGDTIVVGAAWNDAQGIDSGSVYVFVRSGDGWIQQTELLPDDGEAGDLFGWRVAVSGDTVMAAARGDDDNGSDSGAAYVFVRVDSTWTQEAKLITSDGQAGDRLGEVHIVGDMAAVGAPFAAVNGEAEAGAAYVFERHGAVWTEKAKIVAGDPQHEDWFGEDVAIDGDTLAVNAFLEDSGGVNAGAAYVFVRANDTWSQQAKLISGEQCYSCYFGIDLVLEGDTLVVGAPEYPDWWTKIGCAYVFERSGTSWYKTQRLQVSDGAPYDRFGYFVTMEGDIAFIAAPTDGDNGYESGSVYLFTRTDGTWVEQSKLLAPDGAAGDYFGWPVAFNDGTLVVGAQFHDALGEDSGAVYVSTFNSAPIADAGGPYIVEEGSTVTLDGSGSSDPDADLLLYSWDLDNDGDYDDATGVTALYDAALLEGPDSQIAGLEVIDSFGASDSDTAAVMISNVAPTIDTIGGPINPVNISDQPVAVQVAFSDPGTADTHSVIWDWGDTNSDTQTNVTSPALALHTYPEAGVYTAQVIVTDDDGGEDVEVYQYIVVYDIDGGFVTGGGWIDSPEGAYAPDPELTGTASFGFVSKYKRGQQEPTGQTEFQFQVADLNFHSDSYEWLVVNQAGTNAQFKGSGTINGEYAPSGELYKFMIWAGDGELDTFRIRIWYEEGDTEIDVYDNGFGQPIGGGSIQIHCN